MWCAGRSNREEDGGGHMKSRRFLEEDRGQALASAYLLLWECGPSLILVLKFDVTRQPHRRQGSMHWLWSAPRSLERGRI